MIVYHLVDIANGMFVEFHTGQVVRDDRKSAVLRYNDL